MMSPIPVNLAVEDALSESIIRHLLEHANRHYAIGTAYGRAGFGYLQATIRGWNSAARGTPFIVVTDLDQHPCPPALIASWLPGGRHPNLIFQVAVREVEAWLLADRINLAGFLKVSTKGIPADPETLPDPKATLVSIARRSRSRAIRDRIVPKSGSTAQQGPDYNTCLSEFVSTMWNVTAAATEAPSLARAVAKLAVFTPRWEDA